MIKGLLSRSGFLRNIGFYLVLLLISTTTMAQTVSGISLNPSTVTGGAISTGTVTISASAPANGYVVSLSSSLPAYASVPASVLVASGSTQANFTVSTVAYSRTLQFTIKASDATTSRSAPLTSLGDSVATLTLSPAAVVGGTSSTGTLTLSSPAPAGGWTINLSSSLSTYASVPQEITVPEGEMSGTFSVSTISYGRTLQFTIRASDIVSSKSASLTTLGDSIVSLKLTPSTVLGGELSSGNVTLLYPAPTGGWTIALSALPAENVFVPLSITIPAGSTSGSFTVYSVASTSNSSVSVNASDATTSKSATFIANTGFWLAGSVWPKFQGGLQNEGQGLGWGGSDTLAWSFATGGAVLSSPAIGPDGTIYVGSDDGNLYAVSSLGVLIWQYVTDGVVRSSPAIGSDGTIYVGAGTSLYSISNTGALNWKFPLAGTVEGSSPTVESDGSICIGSNAGLYCVTENGSLKYRYPAGAFEMTGSPALGADGTVYMGITGTQNRFYAIGTSGAPIWSLPLPQAGSASVGSDGTIYVGSAAANPNEILAFNSNHSTKWTYKVDGSITSCPAIAGDGTVYVASSTTLYALNPNGTLKWANATAGSSGSSPSIGLDGTIYVGLAQGQNANGLYAFNPDGSLRWQYATKGVVTSSPAIGNDGTVYFGSQDGNLYALAPSVPGYSFPNGMGGQLTSPSFAAVEGDKFMVSGNTDVHVTSLGVEVTVANQPPTPVAIFDAVTGEILASTTVTTGDLLSDGYHWNPIAPLTLHAGSEYYVGALHGTGGSNYYFWNTNTAVTPPSIIDEGTFYKDTTTLDGGGWSSSGPRHYFANFRLEP